MSLFVVIAVEMVARVLMRWEGRAGERKKKSLSDHDLCNPDEMIIHPSGTCLRFVDVQTSDALVQKAWGRHQR